MTPRSGPPSIMGINRKGLHYAGSWEPKPAAHAFRHLASLIDDRLEPKRFEVGFEILKGADPSKIQTYTLREKSTGSPVIAYWLAVPMQTEFRIGQIKITLTGGAVDEPILVDLVDGRVYEVSSTASSERLVFDGLPLADSPFVLCRRGLVEIK